MKILIVGVGALGGVIGARLVARGRDVIFAARDPSQLAQIRVTGVGGDATITPDVRTLDRCDRYDVAVIATKADDALAVAGQLHGTIVPIQNGAVSQLLAERYGDRVIGGLSHLGATMHSPGHYEQKNAGKLLIGELAGGMSPRVQQLGELIDANTTPNMLAAIWTKLIINCSVTTLGAIAGMPMRDYITDHRSLFDRVHAETLAIARAQHIAPETFPIDELLAKYGQLQPSMLQDFTRGRPTEIAYINGYVATLGAAPLNARIVDIVRAIERGALTPSPANLETLSR
ncbi:MAG: 2-dehydropantoate 2-reductase [Kofleriaceae bacterium]